MIVNDDVTNNKDIKALKNYLSDEDADDSLKLDILSWMFDNRHKVNNPKYRDDEYHSQVYKFLIITGIID